MKKKVANHLRLGIFIIGGLGFLVLLLYMIGKNQNLFGSTFKLRARFENVNGLMPGNNVRFAGINAGTVDDIRVLNDTTIEVTLLVKTRMQQFIRKNAVAFIGSDGLMGNKLVNIESGKGSAALVDENDLLATGKAMDTDQMLKVLGNTNDDLAIIISGLKTTVERINNSTALWELMNDRSLPQGLRYSLANVQRSTEGMNSMITDLQFIVSGVKAGKGSVGSLLNDTTLSHNLNDAVLRVKRVGDMADSITRQVNLLVKNLDRNLNQGEGLAHAILRDTAIVNRMEQSLANIQKGTAAFHENMEALKSNFLFRGYFRRQEQRKGSR